MTTPPDPMVLIQEAISRFTSFTQRVLVHLQETQASCDELVANLATLVAELPDNTEVADAYTLAQQVGEHITSSVNLLENPAPEAPVPFNPPPPVPDLPPS